MNFFIRLSRYLVAVLLFFGCGLFADQKEDWLPITSQDLQVREVPGNPGAAAIQLYYADLIDDTQGTEFFYQRIKILTDSGKKWADVEIPIWKDIWDIKDLKARTIRPDGSVVEFTGRPYEKTLVKGRGIRILAKTFTLPEAGPGSIIEYKYRYQSPLGGYFSLGDKWIVQHDLFTLKEQFSYKPGGCSYFFGGGGSRTTSVSFNLEGHAPTIKGSTFEMNMENVPAFQSEAYMPPEENYKSSVRFFCISDDIKTVQKFWDGVGKDEAESIDKFIGNSKEARQAAEQAIGSETDPEKKLRKLYERAQQIRNLDYERERTTEEMKREHLKTNEGVSDVFKRGYGGQLGITAAFVAMARAAGFEAWVVHASNRRDRIFSPRVFSERQLDSYLADVKLNGKDLYFDPATKFCPFGTVRWMHTSTAALRLEKKTGTFIEIPAAQYKESVTRRIAHADLSEDGTLKGEIGVRFQGGEALEHRLDALDRDEAGRKSDLEEELRGWLPSGAIVKLLDMQGWNSPGDYSARFSVEIPAFASVAGKRMLIPAYLFTLKQKEAFTHAERKYPLYFPFTFSEMDTLQIKIPGGYAVESAPAIQQTRTDYASYQSVSKIEGQTLTSERILLFNAIYVKTDGYAQAKTFFSKVQESDEQQAVLRPGGAKRDAQIH
jgi:hypothetical protein